MENVRNKMRVKFVTVKEVPKMLKRQSKIDFDSVKSYDDFDVYNFKNIEVMFDKQNYLGLAILESSKQSMYETYYDIP